MFITFVLNYKNMFSKSCEYGIKSTLYIAQKSQWNERVSLKDISKAINSPEAFTAKILQLLVKANIINSNKGPSGGFEIDKVQLPNINLKQIVQALDGDRLFNGCALGLDVCNEKEPCPMHDKFVSLRNNLNTALESTTLFDVSVDLNLGLTTLKR